MNDSRAADLSAPSTTPGTASADGATTTAFVGGGHMAGALIGGLLRSGHAVARIVVVEPDEGQRRRLAQTHGVDAVAQADERLAAAATVVWAVKPQVFEAAVGPCAPHVRGALQVSVMAGVRSAAIVRATGSERVVRAMPNTPALIGQGIAALFARAAAAPVDRATAEALFAPTGAVLWVDDEGDLDAVTAVSGSGPAYVFHLLEAMERAAVRMGLTPAQGRLLAVHTVAGAAALARGSPLAPQALREQVTSKGGTTAAAIAVLDAAGAGDTLVAAMLAARDRARELGGD